MQVSTKGHHQYQRICIHTNSTMKVPIRPIIQALEFHVSATLVVDRSTLPFKPYHQSLILKCPRDGKKQQRASTVGAQESLNFIFRSFFFFFYLLLFSIMIFLITFTNSFSFIYTYTESALLVSKTESVESQRKKNNPNEKLTTAPLPQSQGTNFP